MGDNLDIAESEYWAEHDRRLAMGWPGKMADDAIHYNSKLVGVTFEGRQEVIKVLTGSEELRVRREADNAYDKNAVAVDVKFGEVWAPIGYIAKDKNADIAATLDAGKEVFIAIASLTGGGEKSYGVNTEIEFSKVKAVKKVEVEEAAPVAETTVDYKEMLNAALSGLGLIAPAKKTAKYTSRLIGKTTEVTITNGHVSLPGYLSGSAFPKKFYAEFNQEEMLQKIVDKHYPKANEAKQQALKDALTAMWALNRDASTGYGTAIHAALENYDTYHLLGEKTKKVEVLKTKTNVGPNKALSRNPFLKKIVEDFHKLFGGDYIRLNEQFIWTHEEQLCGSIDRVKVVDADKKVIRIQDFKTDGDIHEKTYQLTESPFYKLTQGKTPKMGKELLDLHWLQLSFYAYILTKYYGYTVEGLDVYWLNPDKLIKGENAWEEFSHDVIDIEKGL